MNVRSGIAMIKHELHQMDGIATPLVDIGQSPYEIICNHPEPDISVRTLYTYIDKGILCSRNVDLKRKVKFKARKCCARSFPKALVRVFITDKKFQPDTQFCQTGLLG